MGQRKNECAEIGIEGANPKKEILDLVGTLPTLYDKWLEKGNKSLSKCLEKYRLNASEHRNPDTCLPVLSFLLKNGNVTAYEYVHGEAPLKIEELNLFEGQDDDGDNDDGGEICLDLDPVDLEIGDSEVNADIDWGDIVVEDNPGQDIDWSAVDDISSNIVIEESGTSGGVASGDEAYLILDNRRLRNSVIDELNELATFCKMKSMELSQEKQSFLLNDNLMNSGEESASQWTSNHNDINELIENLNGPGTIRTLHLVKTSSTFVNRIVSEMQHKVQMTSRLEDKIESIKAKRQETLGEVEALQKNCSRVLEKTVILQDHIQTDLSKRYVITYIYLYVFVTNSHFTMWKKKQTFTLI